MIKTYNKSKPVSSIKKLKVVFIGLLMVTVVVIVGILTGLFNNTEQNIEREYNDAFIQEEDILYYTTENATVYKENADTVYVTVYDENISEDQARDLAGIPDSVKITIFVPGALTARPINDDELYRAPEGYQE